MAQSAHSTSLLDTSALQNLSGTRVAIVFTEWNDTIIKALRDGCHKILEQYNATITHYIAVPGAFELPFACKQIWESSSYTNDGPEAIIAFGTVIRGGTPHFDYVCKAVTEGITQLNLELPIPTIFGVLTLDNEQQAWERLGGIHGHKGEEAAITALKMIKNSRMLANPAN
ncbi:6,7-dimethyl-8-ribityllumazine synthase [Chitinophagaceae bacterium IBVUCB1]|nr:6,7-dimethyl-8-ribityllumazine synthase [Chitinophagaceae bacterium IBVUCB1]